MRRTEAGSVLASIRTIAVTALFLYPTLAAAFGLLAVPPLVHLINLLRHRRQRWAAMDFLLASYRRQRKWIRFRQFILLLARMALFALLVAAVAGWTGAGAMLSGVTRGTTHHVVLLDDSYSMGRRVGEASAYDRGLQWIDGLYRREAGEGGGTQLTVIRGSRAAIAATAGGRVDVAADLLAATLGDDPRVMQRVTSSRVSDSSARLTEAMRMAAELVEQTPADQTVISVVSDFTTTDWAGADSMMETMRGLPPDTQVQWVDCFGADRVGTAEVQNLAITSLSPRPDVWVAGVPVVMEATVRNLSQSPSSAVTLRPTLVEYGESGAAPVGLPQVAFGSIPAGESVTQTFQVFTATPATHAVTASLADDSLAIDNTRACTLPLSDAQKVLIVDGSSGDVSAGDVGGGYLLRAVLDPGSQVETGAVPELRTPDFIRSADASLWNNYRAVYLVDVPQLYPSAAQSLAAYVRDGGGLAMFLSGDIDRVAVNQELSDRGLLPVRLERFEALQEQTAVLGRPDGVTAPLAGVGDAALAQGVDPRGVEGYSAAGGTRRGD